MKKYYLALVLMIICIEADAQYSEALGKISAKEKDLKHCEFDPEASAVVLLEDAFADYDDRNQLITRTHLRLKVLKEEGVKYGSVSIRYYSGDDYEFIDNIAAITINYQDDGDRKEYRVEKKNIYFKKIDRYFSEVTFAFPEVKIGSILDYHYRSVKKSYWGLKEWEFQSRLPVIKSAFRLKPAPNLEFTYYIQKSDRYKAIVQQSNSEHDVYFEMNDLPGLDHEPYMDSREDYLQKVNFQITKFAGMVGAQRYMGSWNEVARELWSESELGGQLKSGVTDKDPVLSQALAGKNDFDKMTIIYNYVRNNFSWNGYVGIYADPWIKTLWKKKTGTSAAINLLLISLLRDASLEAYPMIVSTRGNGKVNTMVPFVGQFNNTYAAVLINGKQYYLNATDMYTPSHLTPYSILNTTGLIIKPKAGVLTEIAENNYDYYESIFVQCRLSEKGEIAGKVQMSSKNYARADRLKAYKLDEKNYVEEQVKHNLANVKIDSISMSNLTEDTLSLGHVFNYTTGVQQTGDYLFLITNMFTGFEVNPFLSNKRFSNINFGYKKNLILNYVVDLPANLIVDVLPKSIRMTNEDRTISFSREFFYTPDKAQMAARITVNLNKSQYTVDEYPDIKEFYKKMTDLLNEQVVLKLK